MNKTSELIIGWVLSVALSLFMFHLGERATSKRQRLRQAERDGALNTNIENLEKHLVNNSDQLGKIQSDIGDIRERVAGLEAKFVLLNS